MDNQGSIKWKKEVELLDLSDDEEEEESPSPYTAASSCRTICEEEESDDLIHEINMNHSGQIVGLVSVAVLRTLFCN